MLLSLIGVSEQTCGFHHDLGAQRRPVDLGRILNLEHADRLAVDQYAVLTMTDIRVQNA